MTNNQATLDFRSSVRRRPSMYFGHTTELGVVTVVNELVSNGIDLFLHNTASKIAVATVGDTIHYADDGPGLPYDVPTPGNISLAEQYLTQYHTTPTADDHAPHIHLMGGGLGLACVNAVAEHFAVKTWRSGCLWEQQFAKGIPVEAPHIVKRGLGTGTHIHFRLDSEVFKAKLPCRRTLRRLMFDAAHLFPGITLALEQEVFHAPHGLADLASLYYLHAESVSWQEPTPFAFHACCKHVEVAIAAVGEATDQTIYRSWANGCSTKNHGTHVTGLRSALRSVRWKPAVALIHVIMHKPEFSGPTRGSLANPHAYDIVLECVEPALLQWRESTSPKA